MTLQSCIYEGWVRHRRRLPVANEFRYSLFLLYLDLEEIPALFAKRRLWSDRRPAPARFHRGDYLGDPRIPLADAVRHTVAAQTGHTPRGPIRLLTHLRYFGIAFNPVSVYFCFDPSGKFVEHLLLEVTNTPWNERHVYVVDPRSQPRNRLEFPKQFHVSPFLDLDLIYRCALAGPGRRLTLHMDCLRRGESQLDATLSLRRTEITNSSLLRVLIQYPFMTIKVMAGIYWQAFKLWWKGCPAYPHVPLETGVTGP